jgi:hypothetical protein
MSLRSSRPRLGSAGAVVAGGNDAVDPVVDDVVELSAPMGVGTGAGVVIVVAMAVVVTGDVTSEFTGAGTVTGGFVGAATVAARWLDGARMRRGQ